MHQDPIADMLTRIRNANQRKHEIVVMPSSKMKKSIAGVLKAEGYITNFTTLSKNNKESMTIELKYKADQRVIQGLKRVSKPGLRVYANVDDLPRVLNGFGVAMISTPKGLLTDKEARKESVGGEIIAYVW